MKLLMRKKKPASVVFAVLMAVLLISPAVAQQAMTQQEEQQEVRDDFSGEELENFVQVVRVQQEKEVEMIQAIQDEGLELDKFNEILQAQQDPQAPTENISDEEMGKFESATEKVIEIQQEMQMEVMQALNETGLGVQTYQEIMVAYQTNPNVQKEVDELLTK